MHIDSPEGIFPAPRPFFWLPVDGARHAIVLRDKDVPYGEPVGALCGAQLTRAPVDDNDWFWPSCPVCWDAAASLAGP